MRKTRIALLAVLVLSLVMIPTILCGCSDDTNSNSGTRTIQDEFRNRNTSGRTLSWKPIIYLYPQQEMNITVELPKEDNIICSYPKYNGPWNVFAHPNGDLLELNTNRELYSLYYECINDVEFKVEDEGFIVRGDDAAEFLEEKLAILGLTPREAEEFIVYWLPKLESNEYNYVRFATSDEIEENMPLVITPAPDTTIRILMTFKGIDTPIDVKEQQLSSVDREGFVTVEWGGVELE